MNKIALLALLLSLPSAGGQVSRMQSVGGGDHRAGDLGVKFSTDTVFRVSRVGNMGSRETRDQLMNLFDLVRINYHLGENGKIVEGNPFEAEGYRHIRGRVAQNVGGRLYLVYITRDDRVALIAPKGEVWVDGQQISIHAKPVGHYDFTTVMGSGARVIKLESAESLETLITRDQFLDALRAGQTFKVRDIELFPCPTCFGKGAIRGSRDRGQNPDREYRCPDAAPGDPTKARRWHNYTIVWD